MKMMVLTINTIIFLTSVTLLLTDRSFPIYLLLTASILNYFYYYYTNKMA